jgi:FkbM family methyltransferase
VKTIFDLGMHEGWDTEYYLKKGFRVIGVEASPQFVPSVRARLSAWLDRGELVVVEAVLAEQAGVTVPFYARFDKNGWSSLFREVAERDGVASTPIELGSVTIAELFHWFGVPHFLKCDLEGAEALVLRQIAQEPTKPRFVAVEAEPRGEDSIDLLVAAGYARFQIVNQGHLRLFTPPSPPREGRYVDQQFHGKMSGLFGEELPPGHWVREAELRHRLRLWQRLIAKEIDPLRRLVLKKCGKWTRRTWLIDSGWIDIHARLDE